MTNTMTNLGTPERIDKLRNVLLKRQKSITIVLENINDPHNIAACLRSADACGLLEVCIVTPHGQPNPILSKTTSASAVKWLQLRHFNSISICLQTLQAEGKAVWTTNLTKQAVPLYNMNLTKPLALVFGNEHQGVSPEACQYANGNFIIPQIGMCQSLNISVACAVTLFEAQRQRQQLAKNSCPPTPAELTPTEINTILTKWLLK